MVSIHRLRYIGGRCGFPVTKEGNVSVNTEDLEGPGSGGLDGE